MRRFTIAVLIIAGFACPHSIFAQTMSVSQLRTAIQSQLDSAVSLRASYSYYRSPDGALPENHDPDLLLNGDTCTFARDGDRIRLDYRTVDATQPLQGYYFDGETGYDVTDRGDFPRVSLKSTPPQAFDAYVQPFDALGARVRLTESSLTQLLADPSATVVGLQTLDGIECWVVTVNSIDVQANLPIVVTAYCDRQHDYLPRKIVVQRVNFRIPDWHMTWVVTKFAPTNSASGLRWFPVQSEFRQVGQTQYLTVREFEINPQIPVSHFRPDTSEGAFIADVRDPANVKTYTVGDATRTNDRARQLAAAVSNAPPPTRAQSATMTASVDHADWWQRGILACSCLVLAIGLFLWRAMR